jgi:TRAP-type C4-dicarboxylate transport system permease small subunit
VQSAPELAWGAVLIDAIRRYLGLVEGGLVAIATVALVAMMFSISTDAMGRHLLQRPFQGNFEITSLYLMVILVFATLSRNYARGVHVRLDVLADRLAARLGRNYTRLISLICLPVFLLFSWHSGVEAIGKFRSLETHMGALPFPVYLSYCWVAIGAVTLSLRLTLDLIAPEPPVPAGHEDQAAAP